MGDYLPTICRFMRVVLQKVNQASVLVDSQVVGEIGPGYLLLLGVIAGDTSMQAELLCEKISNLRLFTGKDGKINDKSIKDIEGEILVVSQFTLAGDLKKGNRPDYTLAAPPDEAEKLYEYFIGKLKELGIKKVESGKFGAMMEVELINNGPVTLVLEK